MSEEPSVDKIVEKIEESEAKILTDIKNNTSAILQQDFSDKTLIVQTLTNLSVEQKLTFNKLLELQAQNLALLNEILRAVQE